jgi:DNA-binding transcriptional ArsR family regulator
MTPPPRTNHNRTKRRSGVGPPDARVIKAIGHPLRWQMLEALNEGESSPAQLARRFGEPVNLVAYHMGILAKAGGVELVRTEPRRGSTEHYYRATMRPYFADREWARLPAETRRKVLAVETKRIVNDIRSAAAGTGLDHPKAHVSWSPLELDRKGYDEVAELLGGVLEKLHDIQAKSAGRQAENGGKGGKKSKPLSTEVAIVHFERPRRTRRPRAPK